MQAWNINDKGEAKMLDDELHFSIIIMLTESQNRILRLRKIDNMPTKRLH